MKSVGVGLTDIGRRRLANEDAFLVDNDLGLFAVADGMGGHSAGEIASEEAVQTLREMIKREEDALDEVEAPANDARATMPPPMHKAMRVMESAVQAATYMVFGLGQANPEQKGMGTTMSVLLMRGDLALIAQVGDSRIYRIREGKAEQITEDHTLVAWQLKKGLITDEEARHSRQKNVITRAVGSREYVQVDTRLLTVDAGDRFLLCSDGLHGYIGEVEIAEAMSLPGTDSIAKLIDMANQRGGRDNITAVVVEVAPA